MADDLKRSATEATSAGMPATTRALPSAAPSRAERARRTAYRSRFAILYVVLAALAGAAIGVTVILVGRGGPAPAAPWSEWQPVGSAERRTAQIADRVADPYRLPSGNSLVTVTYAGPPTVAGPDGSPLQLQALAVQTDPSSGADDVDTFAATQNVMYILCGRGNLCAIPEGKPSVERGQLLRREALELALYTFKYVDGIESVLVLLPPRADGQAATSVFLERADLEAALRRPLDETLTAPLTPGVGEISVDEARSVDRFTRSRVYAYRPLQQQDGSFVIVLVPALG